VEYVQALESGSSPKIKKAAKAIARNKLDSYGSYLIAALNNQIEKPKAWQTQCEIIKAIGTTNSQEALPTLKELIKRSYENTILYKELAFAILSLENSKKVDLSFLFESLRTENELQIAGACAAILYKKIVPSNTDIQKIISGISAYTDNEGAKLTPRCYIAAISYLWPEHEVHEFLLTCKQSSWPGLIEIASDSLQRKETKIKLI